MALDRCKALKLEDPPYGSSTDFTPTEVAPNTDGLEARAFFLQNGTSADGVAYVSRTGADVTITDPNAGTKAAQDLVTRALGAVASHQALVDIIHFLDEGPGDGWASGASLRINRNGALTTSKTWYASSSPSAPAIVSIGYVYKAGTPLVATKTWTLYTASGAVARTLIDTFTWTGPLLTQVVRTWT